MFERCTEKAPRAIFFARYEASQCGSADIEPEHLLVGILRKDDGVRALLKGISVKEAASKLALPRGQKIATSVDIPLSHSSKLVLAYGAEEAQRLGQGHIGASHLFLGLLHEESRAAEFLREQGVEDRGCPQTRDRRGRGAAGIVAGPEETPGYSARTGHLQPGRRPMACRGLGAQRGRSQDQADGTHDAERRREEAALHRGNSRTRRAGAPSRDRI